eukprot:scaffold23072_cov41-Cyclotella_meneghiniana.AAC.2
MRPRLSNPINHGRPPPIAAQSLPRPTNTITDASATVGAVGGSDSAAMAVTITAGLHTIVRPTCRSQHITFGRKVRAMRGPTNPQSQRNNQPGSGRRYAG